MASDGAQIAFVMLMVDNRLNLADLSAPMKTIYLHLVHSLAHEKRCCGFGALATDGTATVDVEARLAADVMVITLHGVPYDAQAYRAVECLWTGSGIDQPVAVPSASSDAITEKRRQRSP